MKATFKLPSSPSAVFLARTCAASMSARIRRASTRKARPEGVSVIGRWVPVEQARADGLFERADLHAQGRLRDMQPAGGFAEAQFLSHRHEVSQMPQFHLIIHESEYYMIENILT